MTTTENLTINRILNAVAERKATDVHFCGWQQSHHQD